MRLLAASRGRPGVGRQLERARRLVRTGDAQQATALLTALAERDPSDVEVWLELSRTARVRGRADAVMYAGTAHELAPADTRVLRELALALAEDADRLEEARRTIARAIDLDDTDPRNWAVLGAVRLVLGNTGGARRACERGLTADPLCSDAHLVLADVAVASGDRAEAARRFRLVLDLAPQSLEAAEGLAWLEHRQARDEDADDLAAQVTAVLANRTPPPDGGVDDERARPDAATADPAVDAGNAPSTRASREGPATPPGAAAVLRRPPAAPRGEQRGAGTDVGDDEVLAACREHIEAYNRRDIEGLLDGFADDAILRAAGEVVVGREGLEALFANAFSERERTVLQLRNAVVQDGTAVCEMTETARRDGGVAESDLVGRYTVRGGRIVDVRLYRDA